MRGAAVEAVDAPEKLSLRGRFTLAAQNQMHARADSITAFGFMAAILQVLEGIAWPWNQARHAKTSLTVTSDKVPIWERVDFT